MGRNKKTNRRGRLRQIAAGLCATAATIIPTVASASGVEPPPQATEAARRTTPAARLLELASEYPDQVLANRAMRRLRAEDPDAHQEILLAARFARAELPLARIVARTDKPTLRLFACDCAARVAPLYERIGCDTKALESARAAALATRPGREPSTPATMDVGAWPSPTTVIDMALAKVERDVAVFEMEVEREATVDTGAVSALGRLAFAAAEARASRAESAAAAEAPPAEPSRRMVAVAMAAAQAIDDALLVAAGGTVTRIATMREAIAEAVYLDHIFRTGDAAGAIDAVFRELAWQRAHLHALRARGDASRSG